MAVLLLFLHYNSDWQGRLAFKYKEATLHFKIILFLLLFTFKIVRRYLLAWCVNFFSFILLQLTKQLYVIQYLDAVSEWLFWVVSRDPVWEKWKSSHNILLHHLYTKGGWSVRCQLDSSTWLWISSEFCICTLACLLSYHHRLSSSTLRLPYNHDSYPLPTSANPAAGKLT